jgi:HrpA-like RNA helicase
VEADGSESLTPLGVHLSLLPVDVRIGKLILLGAIFGVCDECLTIAAVLSYRSPFLSPLSRCAPPPRPHTRTALQRDGERDTARDGERETARATVRERQRERQRERDSERDSERETARETARATVREAVGTRSERR